MTHTVISAVLNYLSIPYQQDSSSTLSAKQTVLEYAETAILKDESGVLIAIFPAQNRLDLGALKSPVKRKNLRILAEEELTTLENYFKSQSPDPDCKGIRFIFDIGLADNDHIAFKLVDDTTVTLPELNAHQLSNHSLFGICFSAPKPEKDSTLPKLDIRAQLENIEALPVMPEMAIRIMDMRNDPDATIDELTEVVSLDPALAAQVLRYANSALFGQRGQVKTLDDAIFRVLGFENVLHMTLGAAMAKAFKLPKEGQMSAEIYWQNATHSASMAQKLVQSADKSLGLKPGLAYLCGLMHNIGYLVLGTLFPSEYFWFNKVLQAKKDLPVAKIEKSLLGITHMELGVQLMQAWNMPEEIITTIQQHHTPEYDGSNAAYSWLITVTDQILKSQNMSDADSEEVSDTLCARLGLTEDDVFVAMDEVLQSGEELEFLVKSLAA